VREWGKIAVVSGLENASLQVDRAAFQYSLPVLKIYSIRYVKKFRKNFKKNFDKNFEMTLLLTFNKYI